MSKLDVSQIISILLSALACVSCSTNPLTAEVVGLPSITTPKSEVAFKVVVRNESRETQILPTEYEVKFTTSTRFLPGESSGKLLSKLRASGDLVSGDYAITRNSISISPPQFDHLKSGELRVYDFTWTPTKDDRGVGALSIELPFSFPEIPLQPMTILPAEQGSAHQSTTRSESKSE